MGKEGIVNKMKQSNKDAKSVSAKLRLGGVYDTRVGAASSLQTEAQEDTAFAVGLSTGWQLPLKNNFGFRIDYGGYADFHEELDDFNVIDQTVSLEPQYTSGQMIFSLPVSYNYGIEDNKTDLTRYSISPTVTYLIPTLNHAFAFYGLATIINDMDDISADEDGDALGGGCAYLVYFENRSQIRFSASYQNTSYDARIVDYMGVSTSEANRKDDTVMASIDVEFPLHSILDLFLSYSYVHSSSNVDLYDFDRNIIEAGISLHY